MAIAVRTETTLNPAITQASLVAALQTAFTNAGYSVPFDDYVNGTDRILVYRMNFDVTKTYGSNFLRVRITALLQVLQQIYSGWNAVARTGTNGSSETGIFSLVGNVAITFNALNGGNEYNLVSVTQGTLSFVLGIICPSNKPSWWDVSSWTWGFILTGTALNGFRSSSLNPYNTAEYSSFLATSLMSNPNPITNKRDILTGIVLFSGNSSGAAGRTSDDLAIAAAVGSARFDVLGFAGSTEQYLLLNNGAGALAIRIQ